MGGAGGDGGLPSSGGGVPETPELPAGPKVDGGPCWS